MADVEESAEIANVGIWIALIIIALVSFWAQAVTTEERFVPALNVVADAFKMSDDVAGATLMAAGASSPELFSAIVSLFITHSSLGLGTVVGSEIFNQLCICAGAVMEARHGTLQLHKAIVLREMFFYGLGIFLLLVTLRERHPLDGDPDGEPHIFISVVDALVLVLAYVVYVVVLAKFDQILKWLGCAKEDGEGKEEEEEEKLKSYGTIEKKKSKMRMHRATYVRQLSEEPKANFHSGYSMKNIVSGVNVVKTSGMQSAGILGCPSEDSNDSGVLSLRGVLSSRRSSASSFARFELGQEKPSKEHDLEEIVLDDEDDSLSCFLWQHSNFYDRAKFAVHAWQLRWFTFTHDKVGSIPNRASPVKKVRNMPRFDIIELDEDYLILTLICSTSGKEYIFMAPSTQILDAVVAKCKELMAYWGSHEAAAKVDAAEEEGEEEPRLIDFPYGASMVGVFFHCVLFPIKVLMHLTIPDVRVDQKPSLFKASIAIVSCLTWLIVASYYMVASLEHIADLIEIPDSVVGVTVSAAGTSLPNYVASQVAARQGLGNMAVSNAFGSNIFNIMIGLGVPWLLYTIFVTRGAKYSGLIDDGTIVTSVIILASVLLAFALLVAWTRFVLYRWHAYAFLFIYALYVAYSVLQVYVG